MVVRTIKHPYRWVGGCKSRFKDCLHKSKSCLWNHPYLWSALEKGRSVKRKQYSDHPNTDIQLLLYWSDFWATIWKRVYCVWYHNGFWQRWPFVPTIWISDHLITGQVQYSDEHGVINIVPFSVLILPQQTLISWKSLHSSISITIQACAKDLSETMLSLIRPWKWAQHFLY